MRPYLLLSRTDLRETPFQRASRRAAALREQRKRERFETLLREELVAIQELRVVMSHEPKRRWAFAAE